MFILFSFIPLMGPLTKTGVLPKWKSCPLAFSKEFPFLESLLPTWVKFGVSELSFSSTRSSDPVQGGTNTKGQGMGSNTPTH